MWRHWWDGPRSDHEVELVLLLSTIPLFHSRHLSSPAQVHSWLPPAAQPGMCCEVGKALVCCSPLPTWRACTTRSVMAVGQIAAHGHHCKLCCTRRSHSDGETMHQTAGLPVPHGARQVAGSWGASRSASLLGNISLHSNWHLVAAGSSRAGSVVCQLSCWPRVATLLGQGSFLHVFIRVFKVRGFSSKSTPALM